jgi:hypothetical protein
MNDRAECRVCGEQLEDLGAIPCYICGQTFHFSRDKACGIVAPQQIGC